MLNFGGIFVRDIVLGLLGSAGWLFIFAGNWSIHQEWRTDSLQWHWLGWPWSLCRLGCWPRAWRDLVSSWMITWSSKFLIDGVMNIHMYLYIYIYVYYIINHGYKFCKVCIRYQPVSQSQSSYICNMIYSTRTICKSWVKGVQLRSCLNWSELQPPYNCFF